MLAIKNGLKSALRTPVKTLLFLLILTGTAALLSVSFSVFSAVRGYLEDCDNYFHTIAELEYIGQSYPDNLIYDPDLEAALRDNREALNALLDSQSVLSFEPASREFAISPLITRMDSQVPDPNAAVLRLYVTAYDEAKDIYTAIVSECYYSRKDYTGKLIILKAMEDPETIRSVKDLVIAGHFYTGNLPNPCLQQEAISFHDEGIQVNLPLHKEAGEMDPDDPFLRYAEILHRNNDACRVTYSAAVEDLYPFHQQILKLTAGRSFTREEYDSRAHVCILSERITSLLGLGLGDRIPFEVFRAAGDLYDSASLSAADAGDYEIVGTVNHEESWPYWVFLPDTASGTKEIHTVNGYTLGQFRLRNKEVADFLAIAAPILEQGFRINIYDQGYAAATEPMEELLFLSTLFLAVCLLLAVCGLALQAYIFISRQGDAARTMFALGSGRRHVCFYFLSGSLTLTLAAALTGASMSRLIEGRVFELLRQFAMQFGNQDLRFSNTRMAVVRTLDFAPVFQLKTYLTAGLALLAGTFLFTLVFTVSGLREKAKTRGKTKVSRRWVSGRGLRSSRLSGVLKYALLSIRRGGVRTMAVLLLGTVAALFFGQLSSSLEGYKTQLSVYRERAIITGAATDFYGKRINGLVLRSHPIAKLQASGLIQDPCVTRNLGHIQILGPVGGEQQPFLWPTSDFAYETTFDRLYKGPVWTGSSSVGSSPLFHYSKGGSVEWAEGWSEADFIRRERKHFQQYDPITEEYLENGLEYLSGPAICALPKSTMETMGIGLGDEIDAVCAFYVNDSGVFFPVRLTVAAAYTSTVASTEVFSPINFTRPGLEAQEGADNHGSRDHDTWIRGELWTTAERQAAETLGISERSSYSSFTFSLADTKRLDELRSAMEEAGFTTVRSNQRNANCAVIEDEIYLNTTHSMERQIQYVGVLYNALYLLAGVIGFALAWLLVQSRRKEIAVMRALGTQPGRIVGNFLAEQSVLILLGLVLGVGISRLTGAALNRTQLLLTAAFFGLWFLAALICLIVSLTKHSYAALTEPE